MSPHGLMGPPDQIRGINVDWADLCSLMLRNFVMLRQKVCQIFAFGNFCPLGGNWTKGDQNRLRPATDQCLSPCQIS